MKTKITTIILIIVCFTGLSLLLYPTVADLWNNSVNAVQINNYHDKLVDMDEETFEKLWKEAVDYNKALSATGADMDASRAILDRYDQMLIIGDSPIIGYIEIPSIDVTLMISHGTSEDVLATGVGHLSWTSLPVGGADTHAVLSAHRGLPTARLFTDLDKMREGDLFMLNILDETLTYQVDQIRTVEPENTSDLHIVPGKDYVTLLTCTPYGVNTHRLLVRGHRIENILAEAHVVSEAVIIDQVLVATFLAFPILFILLLFVLFKKPEKKIKLEDIRRSIRHE